MELFKQNKKYGFMKTSFIMIGISAVVSLVVLFLIITKGLNYGIDFSGGTVAQIKYTTQAPIESIRKQLTQDPLFSSATINEFGANDEIVIRFQGSTEELGQDVGDKLHQVLAGTGDFEVRRVDMVGPKVGNDLRQKGIMSIVVALVAILIYIAFRFEWRFGIAAVVSQFHDVWIILGIIALFQIDVNLEILAAILTLLAYSLNDTIIVFDRIREELKISKTDNLYEVIDISVSKTLSRTILTSLTTLLVVIALVFFGGKTILGFSITLFFGVLVGTYSSIFVAAPILKWLKFDVTKYKISIALKEKSKKEREKIRAQYEKGMI